MLNKTFLLLALFLFIYNINFRFVPLGVRTRFIIGCIGILYFVLHRWSFQSVKILYAYIFCISFGIFTCILHQTFDFWYVQYLIIEVVSLFGAGILIKSIASHFNIPSWKILFYIVLCITAHNIMSFIGLFFSPVQSALNSIQLIDNQALVESMIETKLRAIGLGDGNYFHGGMISGVGIILVIYLVSRSFITIPCGIMLVVVLLLTGIFLARTTLLGLSGFIMCIFTHSSKDKRRIIRVLFFVLAIGGVLISILLTYASDYLNISWAFELFLNYVNNRAIETASSNDLASMWVWPDNIITFLFGDGKMLNSDATYYRLTDVGILRHIYFWGLIGLFIFIFVQIYTARIISSECHHLKPLVYTLLFFFLILNLKGLIDPTWIFFLILFISIYGRKEYCLSYK